MGKKCNFFDASLTESTTKRNGWFFRENKAGHLLV
jgi:hypothetical protein